MHASCKPTYIHTAHVCPCIFDDTCLLWVLIWLYPDLPEIPKDQFDTFALSGFFRRPAGESNLNGRAMASSDECKQYTHTYTRPCSRTTDQRRRPQ